MKNIFIIVFITIWLFSCLKEDIYLKNYLSDKGISLTITGKAGEYQLDETYRMMLYDSYMFQSYVDTLQNQLAYYFRIIRYSEDYQSNVIFEIGLDRNLNPVLGSCEYHLTTIKDHNKIVNITNGSDMPELLVANLSYNPGTGNLKFNYNFDVDNGSDQNYSIKGSANVKAYQY